MKTLNLVFDTTGWEPAKEDKDRSIQEVTSLVITNVIHTYASQKGGFQESERRLWYKASDALESAVKAKADEVELEDDHFGFIKKCFNEVRVAPNNLIRKVDELIGAVVKR